jgi:hypothetical protein
MLCNCSSVVEEPVISHNLDFWYKHDSDFSILMPYNKQESQLSCEQFFDALYDDELFVSSLSRKSA